MLRRPISATFLQIAIAAGSTLGVQITSAYAQNLRITIPRGSILTPVQRLNREGVDAVLRRHYEKAEALFYKAYLYDPVDPFTLTNLGYVSELHGDTEQAEKFYKLALGQGCEAIIDRTDLHELQGKPMIYALSTAKDMPMRVNRINVLGIEFLSQDRPFEAETLLKEALSTDPANPFTLNNLGVANEAAGDLEGALAYYQKAAATQSKQAVVVTPNRSWRGKPISDLASESEASLRRRMETLDLKQVRATMLTLRGVYAVNRNQPAEAKKYFLDAYALDPQNAFFLNNRGYVAEQDGDTESAKLFYSAAQRASTPNERIGSATEATARGERLELISGQSTKKVGDLFGEEVARRQRMGGAPSLKRREDAPKPVTSTPVAPSSNTPSRDTQSFPAPTSAPPPPTDQ